MKLLLTGFALTLAGTSSFAAAQAYDPMHTAERSRPNAQQPAAKQQAQNPANAIQPSKKATQAILDLQTAVNAKDAANIPAKLAAAQAVATTKEDRYWIGRMQLKIAVDANDVPGAMAALNAIQATGLSPTTELGSLYGAVGATAFNAKQYDQAATAFERQIAIDPTNSEALANLAASRSAGGNNSDALSALQRAIKSGEASGKKADENVYKRAVGIAYDAKLPSAADLSRQWVAAYPGPSSWHNAIAIFRNGTKQDSEGTLDLLRLMQAAGAMQTAADYAMFAQADIDQTNYNEAKAVIDAGVAAKVIDPSDAQFHDTVAALKAKKVPTAANLDAAAKASPSAFELLRIGDRFYGLGDYAKAADLYRQAKAKGKGIDPEVADLHIGMALARAGDKAGATAALSGINGARADLAKYWLIYVQKMS